MTDQVLEGVKDGMTEEERRIYYQKKHEMLPEKGSLPRMELIQMILQFRLSLFIMVIFTTCYLIIFSMM